MTRILLLAGALLLSACTTNRASEAPARLQLVDLTDEFAQHWEQTQGLAHAERVTAFKDGFARLLPGFYDHRRMGLATSEKYDQYLLAALKKFPEQRSWLEEVSRRFSSMLLPAQSSFEAVFGPMSGYPPIYLVNSLGEFDGGTRELPEGVRLLFGADMIAKMHSEHSVQPFFHHELFHLYHERSFKGCEAIWCGLWSEGLATYVAATLNPRATDAELLLSFPEPLRPAVERNRQTAVCDTLKVIDAEDSAASKALFSSGKPSSGLPPRYGYYVGYLVVAEAAKTHGLKQLAALKADEVRPIVEASFRSLATCFG